MKGAKLLNPKFPTGSKSPTNSHPISIPLTGSMRNMSFIPSPNNERLESSNAYMRNMLQDMIKDKAAKKRKPGPFV